jgi:S-adenosylmethionine uptake transporter
MIRNPSVQGALMALSAFGVYALSDMMIKFMGQSHFAVQIIFCAALCSLPFILMQAATSAGGMSLRPALPKWTVVRIVLIVVNSVIVSYTFTKLPVAQAYAIFFCTPLLITLLAVPLLRERLDLPRILTVVAGFAGVLIALRPGSVPLQFAHLTAITGATLGALNSLLLRKVGDRERPSVVLLYPAIAQVLILGCFLPWIWQPMTALSWFLALMIGFLSTIGGVLIIKAYGRAPAIVVAPMQYSQIIWGTLCGVLIFGERMDALMVLGISVIVAAGLFLLWKSGQPLPGSAEFSQKS